MQDSIFTKIIKGEIPCHKIYEDDKTIAFLDIHPLFPGHILVVPKVQVDHFDDLSDEDYQALFATVKKLAKQLKLIMGVKRAVVNVLGFDVSHAHVHVIPIDSASDFKEAVANSNKTDALEPDHKKLAELAEKLAL